MVLLTAQIQPMKYLQVEGGFTVTMIKNYRLSTSQERLRSYLGAEYKKNWIDEEPVIYRNLGNYDIEISGGHTNTQPVSIYVWEKYAFPAVVEYHLRLSHKPELIKKLLDNITVRYTNKEEPNHAE